MNDRIFPGLSDEAIAAYIQVGGKVFISASGSILTIELRNYFTVYYSSERSKNLLPGKTEVHYFLN